jgi:hypothetical protein
MANYATYNALKCPGPPPEEGETLPTIKNEQQVMARRLSAAFNRETALREMRLLDEEVLAAKPKQDAWMPIARELLAMRIDDPERFVHAAFANSISMDNTLIHGPQANGFKGRGLAAQVKNYRNYCLRADTQLESAWQADALQFERAVADMRRRFPKLSAQRIWRFAFGSPWHVQPSALFTYCVAYSEGLDDICEEVRCEAIQQILCDPGGYARVWKDRIPRDLIEQALDLL